MTTTTNRRRSTPRALGTQGRRLWRSVLDVYDLAAHEELLLLQACRTADRLDDVARALETSPLTVVNARGDVVAQPLLVEQRQQSITLTRLVASLRLPDDAGSAPASADGPGDVTPIRPQRRGAARGAYAPRAVGGSQ